jgi:hypothetical protein
MSRGADASWSAPRRIDLVAQATVNVRWAPDGSSLALVSDSTLGLLPMDGSPVRALVDQRQLGEQITFLAWGRDASVVYFQTRDSTGIHSYWSAPVSGGPPRRLLRLAEPGRLTRRAEFDTDGRNLFFTVAEDEADVAVVSLRRP